MNLTDYLSEIEYAASRTIESVWHEREQAETLSAEIAALRKTAEANYARAQSIRETAEDADDLMLGVGIHWDTYFGKDKEQYYKTKELESLGERLGIREFSVSSLAGSLLQYAKQGLSATFGKPANWPRGRNVGSQHLKTIILEGRNQSEHWEEGKPYDGVRQCFQMLQKDFGQKFADFDRINLAFEIVALLDWRTFEKFKSDLLSMEATGEQI